MTTVLYQSTDSAPIVPNSENMLCNLDNKICFKQNIVEGFQEDSVNSYFDTQSVDTTNGDESYIIGNYYKFNEVHRLKQIGITGSNVQIQDNAFKNCRSLEQVNITGNLSYIGGSAFMNNESLVSTIVFPEQEVLANTFYNCRNLSSVNLSNITESIGDNAFKFCANLRTVTIPNGVSIIGKDAFMFCGYNYSNLDTTGVTINIPNTITSIGDNAFRGVPIQEFTFPSGIQLQATSKFMFAHTFLRELVLPEGLKVIDTSTFESSYRLEQVTIPTSVTNIGYAVFANCPSFTKIIYQGTKAQWNAITLDSYWRNGSWETSPRLTVTCTDGNITYSELTRNGYKRRSKILYIDSYGYATSCINFKPFTIPSSLSIHKVTGISNNTVTLGTKLNTSNIEANVPYLIKGTPGYYVLSGKFDINSTTPIKTGKLTGVYEDTECPEEGYILDYRGTTVGFYPGEGEIVKANSAYLTR